MKKSELNANIHLSEGNIKSKNTDDVTFLTWSLPCKITCPYSTEMCRKRCFAQKNQYFKNVLNSRMRNYEETKKNTFVQDVINHLEYHLSRKKMEDKKVFIRIHTSGDFYNLHYFKKWIEITKHFKGNDKILFQAYTKSMPIIKEWLSGGSNINNINIHFVWSIWNDTLEKYTRMAKYLGLQTFKALPKDKIVETVKKGVFECKGDCGNCKQCYTGKVKEIVIPYH